MYEFDSRPHPENMAANSGATMQSREFRRTYGIESAQIGQGRRRGQNGKFGAGKLHLKRLPARIHGLFAPAFSGGSSQGVVARATNKKVRAAWEPPLRWNLLFF